MAQISSQIRDGGEDNKSTNMLYEQPTTHFWLNIVKCINHQQ